LKGNHMAWDVVTLGETMIRFSPASYKRVEQVSEFDLFVGGSESNTAVGLARLGANVLWVSRLTDNFLGHHIQRTLKQHDVDTSQFIWTDQDRVGLYFIEEGHPPRTNVVVYDRRDSAMSKITPDELPAQIFAPDNAKL